MTEKVCATCGVTKPEEAFRLRKSVATGKDYRVSKCRTCHQVNGLAWRRANPQKVRTYNEKQRAKRGDINRLAARESHFRRKFGITIAERDAMLAAQGGSCLICMTTTPKGKGWCVDHDHKTGRIRGILCAHCNVFIGFCRESVIVLERAITYIEANDASRHDT
jgi:hypothetical protein